MQNSASVCSWVSEMLLIVVGVVRVMSVLGNDVLFFIFDFHTTCSARKKRNMEFPCVSPHDCMVR